MLLVALAAHIAPFDTKANYVDLARQHCAQEWPDDYEMQEACLKFQAEGMFQFKAVRDELGPAFDRTLEKCTEAWTKDRIPDFQMIGFCAVSQAEAWKRMNRPSSP